MNKEEMRECNKLIDNGEGEEGGGDKEDCLSSAYDNFKNVRVTGEKCTVVFHISCGK